MEHATHIEGVREAIANLDGKVSRQFTWLVGIQLTTLVTIIAVLLSR